MIFPEFVLFISTFRGQCRPLGKRVNRVKREMAVDEANLSIIFFQQSPFSLGEKSPTEGTLKIAKFDHRHGRIFRATYRFACDADHKTLVRVFCWHLWLSSGDIAWVSG